MESICTQDKCTGCGMCANICPTHAVTMIKGAHDFIFPVVNTELCINCKLCKNSCPSNCFTRYDNNVLEVYAAWSKNKEVRHNSTSGGIFTMLARSIINEGGIVAGVAWDEAFHPHHILVDKEEDLYRFQGSKYSQSITGNIYLHVKGELEKERKVLFSGTPCQNAALNAFLGKKFEKLITLDFVCHGVPSNALLDKYYSQFDGKLKAVSLRKKDPYWDYSFVCLEFENRTRYKALTINDPYFNLFNVGYSLRESCHSCRYTNTHRQADITMADFWGFRAHSFETRDYNKGTSLILVNTKKGQDLLETIKDKVFIEHSSLEEAKRGNKCLSEPFTIDAEKLDSFWKDYEAGLTISELDDKYTANTFRFPSMIALRRLKNKWKWLVKI